MIRYNLRDRDRSHTGIPRNYDIPGLVRAINCDSTQERIAKRGMVGFYGHWPRLKFGMSPAEGGLDSGRAVSVEPAVVTTHLRAFEDGTVEHNTEFLDTTTGQIARRMSDARVGGFSSAIDAAKPEFYGFDYVNDPNYSTNRPYALDSATWGELTLDDVIAQEIDDNNRMLLRLIAIQEANGKVAMDENQRLAIENEELIARIERLERDLSAGRALMDSARVATDRMLGDIDGFRSAGLPPLDRSGKNAPKPRRDPIVDGFLRRFDMRR